MCGIAGLVDYGSDTQDHGTVISAMTDAQKERGPDSRGVWVTALAALGVRRLSVIDPLGGEQPMVAQRPGEPPVALAYTGEIFNCPELRAELGARGHRFTTSSDTEVVLKAYLEWGGACAERLLGMFAFAVWDERTEEMFLIRDRFGIYPLYWAETDNGLAFGSAIKALLQYPGIRAEIDITGLRAIMAMIKPAGHGVLRGMHEVDPGTVVRFSRSGPAISRYWSLQAVEHTDDLDTTVRTIRDLLEDSVRRQVVADAPIGFFLSGGLDSSALAALATKIVREDDALEKLRTYSVDYAGHADLFDADEVRSTPDFPFVEVMSKHLATRHTRAVLTTDQLLDPAVRTAVLTARDLPTFMGDLDTSLYLLCKQARAETKVSLVGDGADEYLGGYPWFHDERFCKPGTLPWMEFARQIAGKNQVRSTGLLSPDLADSLDAAEYELDVYESAVAQAPVLDDEPTIDRLMRQVTFMNMSGYLRIVLDRKDRIGMAVALEGRVPYLDHRLVEYVYSIPWAMKTFDGREKSLLRAAVRDLLPPSVLYRMKAGYPPTDDPRYGQLLTTKLAELIADETAPVRPLMDLPTAQSYVDNPAGPAREVVNKFSLEMMLSLNEWLDRYQVRLDL
jgi:asparagine synthase (glutamine-hydrolysing)